ncbi:MAG: hypothetical protein LBK06_00505 [Planctomycetaceae bacterium]|jgi:hypothetical protein|nr:hypothetical protein [Planctomycetaceae bacterium]
MYKINLWSPSLLPSCVGGMLIANGLSWSVVKEQTFVATVTKETLNIDQASCCTYRIDESIGQLTDINYRLPDSIEQVEPDSPIEIPIVKRMVFKFGKPQKKEFVFIED